MATISAPEMTVQASTDQLQLNISLKSDFLPPNPIGIPLDIGLSAVIETCERNMRTPQLSYWALCHPSKRPDFHDRRAFSLKLAPALATSLGNTAP